uniref:ionotropic receptor 149 precursor n=1 Tax=Aedes aegypti TaxID=7159 RepID=UPI000C2840B8|nr:ionotropic receptor 149 precursor [Aedes aegypti]
MHNITTSLIILSLWLHCNADANVPSNVLYQTERKILQAANEHFGRFDCVFLDLNSELTFSDDWINSIITSPKLGLLPRYVLSTMFNLSFNNFPHKPGLIVSRAAQQFSHEELSSRIMNFFYSIDCNTRVLMLMNTLDRSFLGMQQLVTKLRYDKVVYLMASERLFVRCDVSGKYCSSYGIDLEIPHIFRSILRNSSGQPIKTTSLHPWHVVIRWTIETSKFLKTTISHYSRICNKNMTPIECINILLGRNGMDMSMDQFMIFFNYPQKYHAIHNVHPSSLVILVPQSRKYTGIEIFTKPFAWETWIALIILLSLTEVFSTVFPDLFRNDPLLLAICGLQRYNLHRATVREKLTMVFLIIFFYVIVRAYETKVISFIINKPSVEQIKDIQGLVKSGLKIKTDMRGQPSLVNDSLIGALMIQEVAQANTSILDGRNAYMMSSIIAPFVTSLWSNYDFIHRRPKYVVLDERRSTGVLSYWFNIRSPFSELFQFTLNVFFESGLLEKWQEESFYKYRAADRAANRHMVQLYSNTLELVTSSDLVLLWAAWSTGLAISLLCFIAELVTRRIEYIFVKFYEYLVLSL